MFVKQLITTDFITGKLHTEKQNIFSWHSVIQNHKICTAKFECCHGPLNTYLLSLFSWTQTLHNPRIIQAKWHASGDFFFFFRGSTINTDNYFTPIHIYLLENNVVPKVAHQFSSLIVRNLLQVLTYETLYENTQWKKFFLGWHHSSLWQKPFCG